MEKEFLENLNIGEEAVAAILAESQKESREHSQELNDLRFDHLLENAIGQMHGRNAVAIRALLDVDSLKKAEDPDQAVSQALEQVKQENAYLFEDRVPAYAAGAGMGSFQRSCSQEELGRMSMAQYKAYRRGKA